jgi:hypothetical protein
LLASAPANNRIELGCPRGQASLDSAANANQRMASDERILGNGEFIEEVMSQAEKRLEETLRLKARKVELSTLASRVSRSEGTDWDLVRSGSRAAEVVKTRRLFCQLAVKN